MRSKPIIVVDLIREVVEKTNTAVIAELQAFDLFIFGINYQPGTLKEINETLTQMSEQPSQELKRYPLFALLTGFSEQKGRQIGVDGLEDLEIIIGRRSKNATDKTPKRYDDNFRPVLYPIYLEFLNQIDLDRRFLTKGVDLIQHSKIDWPYYNGGNDANPFGDWIDVIILKLQVKILLKNC